MDSTRSQLRPTAWLAAGIVTGLLMRPFAAAATHRTAVSRDAVDEHAARRGERDDRRSRGIGRGRDEREGPDTADRARAAQRGRGRQAVTPRQIPWLGWKD